MPAPPIHRTNVADRLATAAAQRPQSLAVAAANGHGGFDTVTFAELDTDATRLACGLATLGIGPGKRIALLVKPGVEFVTLVFALLRTGATMVLVDAGLGRENIVRCLASTEPDGFVAIPLGHALRVLKRKQFPNAKLNVTVGRRWFWGGETLRSVRRLGERADLLPTHRDFPAATRAEDPAAIVFTSGSTGPPKGVLYTHQTFVTQCDEIQRQYELQPGAVDLACFPLFGLFNVACGITTVLPQMDFSRPASCDPHKVLAAANQWQVTQAFASPAVWDRLSRHCEATGATIPTLKNVFSCGAPVSARVLRRTLGCVHRDAQMHTPYGATEALPVATIEAQEILGETAAKTDAGAGVCVGRKFDTIDWRIIRISDDPLTTIDETDELPRGEIGELIVRGPQVSTQYQNPIPHPSASDQQRSPHNELAKIKDGDAIWHRLGDVGYFDAQQRFWYCGRKSQRVRTASSEHYADQIEAYFNGVAGVRRTALVGVPTQGETESVLVYEPAPGHLGDASLSEKLAARASQCADRWRIPHFLEHRLLPTDIRHNSKIRREALAIWAAEQLR
ncbi:fatty acid CoA ligase family protein [Botrimarina hoheduenensis]|uniref:Long-chain-fatty-acid--CoA ligase n=1 Tax=Botrimarina hoheduenensis TaxID=2528000 RepID=A0A5C5WC95_9BACT|nr:fatty acid CoA ligase family protein [Botrimarina hoheduenensis]TWT47651.1 Long-chain-fatty-acid--CoA ligase [Botrimarina hoheduenensis]